MSSELILPKGSLVLVTGCNGYIASHVVDQLLTAGYKVRGTTRTEEKAKRIAEVFERRHGKGGFESVVVKDFLAPNAFGEAMKGCDAVAHVASAIQPAPDPNVTIPAVKQTTLNLLNAAKACPTIKRVVLTSSSIAAVKPAPNKEFQVTADDWNETDLVTAWAPPPYTEERILAVYAASKIADEKAAWEFMKTEKPGFEFNAVLPSFTTGEKLLPEQAPMSTPSLLEQLYKGEQPGATWLRYQPPLHYVDVKDTAKHHVAALIYKDVANERIFSMAKPLNYQMLVDVFAKINPQKEFPPAVNQDKDLSKVTTEQRNVELLKRLGQHEWTPLEKSLRETLQSVHCD